MIGVWDYTVVLTYLSACTSFFGMAFAINNHFNTAIVCLAISGLLDMFDGKVARKKKDRSEEAKKFGIQIDSLCDVICFGVFPIVICYCIGIGKGKDFVGLIFLFFYGIAGIVRLAYFNVKEEMRQKETNDNRKYYQGLPITSISVVLPIIYVLSPFFPKEVFFVILRFIMLAVGVLFVTDFKFKKPSNAQIAILVLVVVFALMIMFTSQWLKWKR